MTASALPELPRAGDYVTWYAARVPDAPAAWFDGACMSYAELERRIDATARALVGLGLHKGERVAVLSTPRTEFLVAWLAILRAGLVYVGLNPRYTHRELAYVVGDAQPGTVLALSSFATQDFEPEVARLRAEFPLIRHAFRLEHGPAIGVLAAYADLLSNASPVGDDEYRSRLQSVQPRDPAVIVYTSGSTGAPKGAVIPHESLVYGPRTAATAIGIERPRAICALPTNHIGCLADMCMGVLVAGGMIAFMDRFDAGRMLELIESLKLTSLQHTPTVLQMLVQHPNFLTRDLSSLQFAGWGGAALPIDALRAFRRMGLKMLLAYGQTECVSNICWADETYSDEDLATTVGRPDPNQVVKLVDENLNEVPNGQPGELITRHHAQMLGYFNRPEATAAVFTPDGFLRTGDVGIRRPDGVIRLVGRRSEMYKSGGYNVYPREIELCLEEHPAIGVAAVIGVPDPVYSEVGLAYVMARPDQPRPTEDRLRAWCRDRLANYKIPKQIFVRDELPLLPIGKVDKQALRRDVTELSQAIGS